MAHIVRSSYPKDNTFISIMVKYIVDDDHATKLPLILVCGMPFVRSVEYMNIVHLRYPHHFAFEENIQQRPMLTHTNTYIYIYFLILVF